MTLIDRMLKGNCCHLPRVVLIALGVNMRKEISWIYRIYHLIMVMAQFSYPCSNLHLLTQNLDDYDVVINSLFNTNGGLGAVLKTMVIICNRKKFVRIFEKVDKLRQQYNKGAWSRTMVYNFNKLMLMAITSYYASIMYFYASTIINRFLEKDPKNWKLPISEVSVFDWRRSPMYEVAWLYQVVAVTVVSSAFCIGDLLVAGLLVDMTIQFRILEREIKETFDKLMSDSKDAGCVKNTAEELQQTIKQKVIRHLDLIDLVNEIEEVCSLLIFVTVTSSLAVLSFSLYYASVVPITDYRALQSYVEVLMVSVSLFFLCYCGTAMSNASGSISTACYDINFVGSDSGFQKSLMLMMVRSQKPVKVTVRRFATLSITIFVWILRTAYSYFMVLRKRNN